MYKTKEWQFFSREILKISFRDLALGNLRQEKKANCESSVKNKTTLLAIKPPTVWLGTLDMNATEKLNTFFVVIEFVVRLLGIKFTGFYSLWKDASLHPSTDLCYPQYRGEWFPFLCHTCSIVHCKTFPKEMAVWFGWMPGSCFHDISTCSRLDHLFG